MEYKIVKETFKSLLLAVILFWLDYTLFSDGHYLIGLIPFYFTITLCYYILKGGDVRRLKRIDFLEKLLAETPSRLTDAERELLVELKTGEKPVTE